MGRRDGALAKPRAGGHFDAPAAGHSRGLRDAARSVRGGDEAGQLNGLLANHILSALPADDFARLLPRLQPVTLSCGEDLYKFEGGADFAYFPESAVVSHLHVLTDGSSVEATMIGREGVVGLSTVFSSQQPSHWTRALIAGSAMRVDASALRQEFKRGGALQRVMLRYASARMMQLSQRAVCNGRHTVEKRLSTWLLLIHDRTRENRLPLTHEQIAGHLGARRAGITTAASALRDRRVISYCRGVIHILCRDALEASACECYHTFNRAPTPRAGMRVGARG